VTDRTQTITIDDTTNPTVGLIYPVTVECRGDARAEYRHRPASDNCSTPVVTHLSDVSNGQTCPEITRTIASPTRQRDRSRAADHHR
jgi:hypothetical protein